MICATSSVTRPREGSHLNDRAHQPKGEAAQGLRASRVLSHARNQGAATHPERADRRLLRGAVMALYGRFASLGTSGRAGPADG